MLEKLTIRLPAPVAESLSRFAAESHLSTSAAAAQLLAVGLDQADVERRKTNVLFSVMLMVEALAEKQGIDTEPLYQEGKQIVAEELYGEAMAEEGEVA